MDGATCLKLTVSKREVSSKSNGRGVAVQNKFGGHLGLEKGNLRFLREAVLY